MSDLTNTVRNKDFAEYAEKHGLFDMFQKTLSELVIAKPPNPYQFLIDAFSRKTTRSVLLLAPPGTNISHIIDIISYSLSLVHIDSEKILSTVYTMPEGNVDTRMNSDCFLSNLIIKQLQSDSAAQQGYILSGFPRNRAQAAALLRAGYNPSHIGINVFYPVDCSTNESDKEQLSNNFEIANCFTGNYKKINVSEEIGRKELLKFLGTEPVSKAPRSFRIILSGLPGSGKTTIAEKIAKKYGAVLVSPKNVILRAISSGLGEIFLPYLENLHLVPTDILGQLIAQRLKDSDCLENGWILDGFPITENDVQLLFDHGITPNRVIWLDTPPSSCWNRLFYRRHALDTSDVVNLKNLPNGMELGDYENWLIAPEDEESKLKARFSQYQHTESVLKSRYGVRTLSNNIGVFHHIQCENAENESSEMVFEFVQGYLSRPIPVQID